MVNRFEDLPPELEYEIGKKMPTVDLIKFERVSKSCQELVSKCFKQRSKVYVTLPTNGPNDKNKEANIQCIPDFGNCDFGNFSILETYFHNRGIRKPL